MVKREEKRMKKLIALLMSLTLCIFMFAACAQEEPVEETATETEVSEEEEEPVEPEVVLNPHESNGFTFLLPEDFGPFENVMTTTNKTESTEFYLSTVEVTGPFEVNWGVEAITEEVFYDRESPHSEDLTILEFDNTGTFTGYPAVFAHYTYVRNDIETEHYFYEIFMDDGTAYKLTFTFNPLDESLLQMNIEDVIAGVTKN